MSTLNNGAPAQVQILSGPNVSKNALTTAAGFVDDTWRLNGRVTLLLECAWIATSRIFPNSRDLQGRRSRRWTRPHLQQLGPARGMSADLTGDGKTVLKLHYGQFWLSPGTNFTSAFNPNPPAGRRPTSGPTMRTRTADGILARKDD